MYGTQYIIRRRRAYGPRRRAPHRPESPRVVTMGGEARRNDWRATVRSAETRGGRGAVSERSGGPDTHASEHGLDDRGGAGRARTRYAYAIAARRPDD